MGKTYNPYIKQSIELAEEDKKQIVISSDLINSTTDDCILGKTIREMLSLKITECDKHIKHMKTLE